MKLVYVGPFHRFAYGNKGVSNYYVVDAESPRPLEPVAEFDTEAEARTYIEQRIAADPTMREDAQ